MYFYIQDNKDWNSDKKVKYGIADEYKSRLKTDQHSYKSEYISLFEYKITDEYKLDYKEIDNIISKQQTSKIKLLMNHHYPKIKFENLFKIKEFLINHGGGTEFIRKDGIELLENILLNDFPKLGIIIRKIPKEEWIFDNEYDKVDKIVACDKVIGNDDNYEVVDNDDIKSKIPILREGIRDYQQIIIDECLKNILIDKRSYISLPTGGGKSYIAYKMADILLKDIKSTIIILTPRINICEQNIKEKYVKLLTNKYIIHKNFDNINNNDNNIICCCINSIEKVVKTIIKSDLKNILIWFDEAHIGIESWVINDNKFKHFLLNDNEHIKYRLFTSASPDREFVYKNNKIFGEFINPVKTKDLIADGWLCKLDAYIYKDEIHEDVYINDSSHVNLIINNFKNVGLCFSNSCENALNLYKIHLELYKKDKTIPKPYLLLNSATIKDYIKNKHISNEDMKLYSIDGFEEEEGIRKVGYIVKMYSLGYDNPKIDFIFFKDPKLSYKDIIQSIGRGLRPCGNKRTAIHIPVYIDNEDDANKYDKIKEVIKYLVLDVELNIKDIKIINSKKKKSSSIRDVVVKEYEEFTDDIETILYEIVNKNMTHQMIIRQLKYNNIHNYSKYSKYIKDNELLKLPEKLFEVYPSFDFNETYINNSSPYYSRKECIEMIKKYQDDLIFEDEMDKENNNELLEFLIKKDKKIPNECLWMYYGGDKKDFIIFV